MSIAKLLGSLADGVAFHARKYDWWVILWKVILLLIIFNVFWNTRFLIRLEKYGYVGFLYSIIIPLLTYYAAVILVDRNFYHLRKTFFSILFLLQVWTISYVLLFTSEFHIWWNNLIFAVLAITLAFFSKKSRFLFKFCSVIYFLLLLITCTLMALQMKY